LFDAADRIIRIFSGTSMASEKDVFGITRGAISSSIIACDRSFFGKKIRK